MSKALIFYLSLSILRPAITGIVRFGRIRKSYYPLIYLLIVGVIVEIISYNLSNNAILANLYILTEFILYCWLFYNLKNIITNKKWLYLLVIAFSSLWFFECLILAKIRSFDLYFRIIYSFALVLLAVNQLNYLIINERENIVFNAVFILCCSMIIFF